MNLTFEEILNKNFENKIKDVKNKIKKAFKEKENKFLLFLAKKRLLSLAGIVFIISPIFFLNLPKIFGILVLMFALIFMGFIIQLIENVGDQKIKTSLINIAEYYYKKDKKINSTKVKEVVNKLSQKEKEILYDMNSKNTINKKNIVIKNEILKTKIRESSLLELEKYKGRIYSYISTMDNKKEAKKLEKLVKERLKEKNYSLFEEKEVEKKVMVNV